MRVIAGKARRIQLKTIDGLATRPTTDRIKETLFNMIQPDLYDASFLDLFAGSGAIGIEALSRGCKDATFVENSSIAVRCIEENLKVTKLNTFATVLTMDATQAIATLNRTKRSFDFIFMDPPYNKEYEKQVLQDIKDTSLLHEDTIIIIEASLETEFDYVEELGYTITKVKQYKTNKHVFVRRQG